MSRTAWTFASLFVVVGLNSAAPPPDAPDFDIEVTAKSLAIPISMTPKQRAAAQTVELMVSSDHGMSYQQAGSVSPNKEVMQFTPPADGVYWFYIGVYDKEGRREPPSPYSAPPQLRLRVTLPKK